MKFYSSLAVVAMLLSSAAATRAQNLPSYMAPISGLTTTTPADIATKDVLALNTGMFELYGDAGKVFQANILAKHPVILGLFSGSGGRFTLYRPGMAPLDAPQVPVVYQLLKSVGHSTMALAEVVGPYLDNPANTSWRGSMLAYRSRMQSALDGLDTTPMQPEWRDNNRTILKNNIAFMDDCVAKGVIAFSSLEAFGKKQAPYLAKNVAWAAQTQVNHWMTVLADWKTMLGPDWDKAYAASNTIYVARQNNVLFSVLAQFFPPEAINDRLLLIETVSFTTTQADMLDSLTRIIADRSVGSLFFGNYHLMDYELMGGDARAAIIAESGKRGMTPFLPPVVPFGSHQWPTLVTPGPGPASIADLK
ncbi:hypothetical protein [Bradyrhizobium canariense]|uniref:Uncharacterized protein n=1 Tax=Bradyrhizobium canariense TaxID=255045 RepID=A0A1H1WIF4_9BRAD|nr:hypothetical protein [Bradyrhizobium canariense]SDS96381.1 hypothetical protein SAMN05444158_3848 [Bradyrhizobium canariense]